MTIALVLYGTESCHLCDEASAILLQLGLDWQTVDIAEDDELLERYGSSIPVLRRLDCASEIRWPFQTDDVQRLLSGEPS